MKQRKSKISFNHFYFPEIYFKNSTVEKNIIILMYEGFLRYHTNIPIETIIINTGYTDRILESEKLMKFIKSSNVVYIPDKKNPYLKTKTFEKNPAYKFAKRGDIVFATKNNSDLFGFIHFLNKLEYCDNCNEFNILSVDWFLRDKKYILYVLLNTESG
jgi:hypothetical protein